MKLPVTVNAAADDTNDNTGDDTNDQLPVTGSNVAWMTAVSLIAIAAGVTLRRIARRR